MAHRHLTLIAAAALLLATGPALAGKTAVGGIGGLPVFVPNIAPTTQPGAGPAALASPQAVAQELSAANNFCAQLPERAYIVDCLAERLDAISRSMPATGDLADARAQIAEASRELEGLARGNADRSVPRATARTPSIRTSRPLVPVERGNISAVAAQAAVILERTETLLLRSSSRADYRQISAAVGASKVLLRSV